MAKIAGSAFGNSFIDYILSKSCMNSPPRDTPTAKVTIGEQNDQDHYTIQATQIHILPLGGHMAFAKSENVFARSVRRDEAISNFKSFTSLSGDCFGKDHLATTYRRSIKRLCKDHMGDMG